MENQAEIERPDPRIGKDSRDGLSDTPEGRLLRAIFDQDPIDRSRKSTDADAPAQEASEPQPTIPPRRPEGGYRVYVDKANNTARVHLTSCRHFQNRKPNTKPDNVWLPDEYATMRDALNAGSQHVRNGKARPCRTCLVRSNEDFVFEPPPSSGPTPEPADGEEVYTIDEEGNTPLHLAALEGDVSLVRRLIRAGAYVGARNGSKLTPLQVAAKAGHADVVRTLIRARANTKAQMEPALPLAAEAGAADTVRALIAAYAFPEAHLEDALGIAAEHGHSDTVRVLIAAGANADGRRKSPHDSTPLRRAVLGNHADTIRVLIEAGADPNPQVFLDKYGGLMGDDSTYFESPLRVAQLLGHDDAVRALEEAAANAEGMTALHIAAREGAANTVCALLEDGANTEAKDNEGKTPLHWAAIMGEAHTARLLIVAGADADARDEKGQTPLHMTADFVLFQDGAARSTARELIKGGAKCEARDKYGLTPLHHVAGQPFPRTGVVRTLLSAGASAEAKDDNGRIPADYAASRGHDGIVRLLKGRPSFWDRLFGG